MHAKFQDGQIVASYLACAAFIHIRLWPLIDQREFSVTEITSSIDTMSYNYRYIINYRVFQSTDVLLA